MTTDQKPQSEFRMDNGELTNSDKRIAVVGATGSGKTTFARSLARGLEMTHIDLDALFWEANWTPGDFEVVKRRIIGAMAGERWVSDGNYGRFREYQLPRTTTLVWLDYSLPVCLLRLLRRTIIRTIARQELSAGNRESFRKAFFSRKSIFLWLLRQHPKLRQHYTDMVGSDREHLNVIRLNSPTEAQRLLARVHAAQPTDGKYCTGIQPQS